MKALGIIAEYNPFHNGHFWQLKQGKRLAGADLVVVVMAGNFLQRGEPAIIDKWARAELALTHGADLVVELPVAFATQWASDFARGGVQILRELQVAAMSFGAEQADATDLYRVAEALLKNSSQILKQVSLNPDRKLTYPEKYNRAVEQVLGDLPIDLSQSNNILALTYMQEAIKLNYSLAYYPVKRDQASHKSGELNPGLTLASGTAIRRAALAGQNVQDFVPSKVNGFLKEQALLSWRDFFPYVKYHILSSPIEDLKAIYQMDIGLGEKLKKAGQQADNFPDFLQEMDTKHLTQARIQRLLTYVLLNIQEAQMLVEKSQVKALRILGFTQAGQSYLNLIKKDLTIPLITNLNQNNRKLWALDIKAGDIYRLGNLEKIPHQDFKRHPLIFD